MKQLALLREDVLADRGDEEAIEATLQALIADMAFKGEQVAQQRLAP